MIQFFRNSDILRWGAVVLVFLVIRLPLLLSQGFDAYADEFSWILVGEYLAQGKQLYVEAWERLEILTAWTYGGLYSIFGRNTLGYRLVGVMLGLLQVFLFRQAVRHPDLYRERTTLPTFIFVLLLHSHATFLILSPTSISLTFLLLALDRVFLLDERTTDYEIFRLGIYIGLASLAFFGSIAFLLFGLISLGTFRGTKPREYLVFLYGSFFPPLLFGLYLYQYGALELALNQIIVPFVSIGQLVLTFTNGILDAVFLILAAIGLLLGVFKVLQTTNFVNFQTVRHQAMTVWGVICFLGILITLDFSVYQSILFMPMVAFFFPYFLMARYKKWRVELFFGIYTLLIFFSLYQSVFNYFNSSFYSAYADKVTLNSPPDFQDKRIWVLDTDPSWYQSNYPVMPYLDSRLFILDLQETQSHASLVELATEIRQNRPEIIIDPQRQFSIILKKIPLLREDYQPNAEETEWRLRNKDT
ncbi:MAG: hypothetical protein AAF740_01960 [Bacteroidota bacterium]